MKKGFLGFLCLAALSINNVAYADDCAKTLMGSDCDSNAKGVSSHMRGNAVENAKAAKELKEAQLKAKKEAKAIANAKSK
jgi:hypothetical protein